MALSPDGQVLVVSFVGERLVGKKIAVLGITFKPDTDDLRDSPALDIASRLWGRGAELSIVDPAAGPQLRARRPDLHRIVREERGQAVATLIRLVGDIDVAEEAVQDADAVMLLTPWKEYVNLDPAELIGHMRQPNIIDGRNVLNPQQWADAGWNYIGMGRGVSVW